MDPRLQAYEGYYRARVRKYEGNPLYPNALAAEKALYDALVSAKTGDEFKKKLFGENLHLKNAIALVRDQETARLKYYEEIKETIRANGPRMILAELDSIEDVTQLTTRVNELHNKNSVEISVDELLDEFYSDFTALENIEVYEKAEVPARWEAEFCAAAKEMREAEKKDWRESVAPNARNWDPNWKINYDKLWEERHRRRIPIPDESLKRRIAEHKLATGAEQ